MIEHEGRIVGMDLVTTDDFFKACVARILGTRFQSRIPVPCDGRFFSTADKVALSTIVKSYDVAVFYARWDITIEDLSASYNDKLYYVACGPSPSKTQGWHSVVLHNGRYIYDPSPEGKYLAGPAWLYVGFLLLL